MKKAKRLIAVLMSIFVLTMVLLPLQPMAEPETDESVTELPSKTDPVPDEPVDTVTFSRSNMTITNLLYGWRFFTDWKKADVVPADLSGTAENGANSGMALRTTIRITPLREGVDIRSSWNLLFRFQSSFIEGKEMASKFYEMTAQDVKWIDETSFEVIIPLMDIATENLDWSDVQKLYIAIDLDDEYRLESAGVSPDMSITISDTRIEAYEDMWSVPEKPDEEPLLTIACLTDLHTQDRLLTSTPPYPRGTVINTINQMKETEKVDVVLIGGDVTSNNHVSQSRLETALKSIQSYTDQLTKNVLWVAGNHDYNAGERDGYNSAPFYDVLMKDAVGELAEDEAYYETYNGIDYMLAYHYVINGFDFVCLNPSPEDLKGGLQNTNYRYTSGTYDWIEKKLAELGKESTIFVMGHMPVADSRGLTDHHKQVEESSERMCDVFKDYPNLIYLYGHDHGSTSNVYIKRDTAQRVTQHDSNGGIVGLYGDPQSPGFITSFMGSMRYYNTGIDGSPGADNSKVVQALMVYVYKDQIRLEMKNYGEVSGGMWNIKPYVIERQVVGAIAPGDVDGKDSVTANDALMALQAATGKIGLDDTAKAAADVDGVDGITANDALVILQYATKKITAFPKAG